MAKKQATAKTEPEKKWPQVFDLLAWHIYDKLDGENLVNGPGQIADWISDVFKDTRNHAKMHKRLYEQYVEFQEEFLPPDYTG